MGRTNKGAHEKMTKPPRIEQFTWPVRHFRRILITEPHFREGVQRGSLKQLVIDACDTHLTLNW